MVSVPQLTMKVGACPEIEKGIKSPFSQSQALGHTIVLQESDKHPHDSVQNSLDCIA